MTGGSPFPLARLLRELYPVPLAGVELAVPGSDRTVLTSCCNLAAGLRAASLHVMEIGLTADEAGRILRVFELDVARFRAAHVHRALARGAAHALRRQA